jgi:hypothetical protein
LTDRDRSAAREQRINLCTDRENLCSLTDSPSIAEEFNIFFSSVGTKIANDIPPYSIDPLSYIQNLPNIPELAFNPTGPSQTIDLLKKFISKSTPDLDGISIKLLKFVSNEIDVLCAHIFNFKVARVFPVFKAGDRS